MNKTIINFQYSKEDLFEVVSRWAADNGYDLKTKEENTRVYKNGSYWSFNAHTTLLVKKDGKDVTLEVWINPIWGGKMDVNVNGIVAVLPRKKATKQVNELLQLLGQKKLD